MSRIISFERAQLNLEGHTLLDALKTHFPEWKVRASLSKHLGMTHYRYDLDTGFHFSKHEPIETVRKAVHWLRNAKEQQSLSPHFHPKPTDVVLSQAQMKQALAALKQPHEIDQREHH